MKRFRLWLTPPLLFAGIGSQSAVNAAVIPETMNISAPGGHYQNPKFALPCKKGELSAILRLNNLQFAEVWQAGGSVRVHNAKDWIEVGAFTKYQKRDHLYALWVTSTSPHKSISSNPAAYLLPQHANQSMNIDVTWSEKGEIGATLNGKALSPFRLSPPLTEISFFVEGAEATLDQITVSCNLTS